MVRRRIKVPARRKDTIRNVRSSESTKGELLFPVRRIHRYLKNGNIAKRISHASAIFLAAVIEYIIAEVLDVSATAAQNHERARITLRHLTLAIYNDKELNGLFKNVDIIGGGVLPCIHKSLLPEKTTPTKKTTTTPAETTPTKRGRPKKTAENTPTFTPTNTVENSTPTKRGRPKKTPMNTAENSTPTKRGRPKKTPINTAENTPTKRGRPKKAAGVVVEEVEPAVESRFEPEEEAIFFSEASTDVESEEDYGDEDNSIESDDDGDETDTDLS